jgi:hypothetical protein
VAVRGAKFLVFLGVWVTRKARKARAHAQHKTRHDDVSRHTFLYTRLSYFSLIYTRTKNAAFNAHPVAKGPVEDGLGRICKERALEQIADRSRGYNRCRWEERGGVVVGARVVRARLRCVRAVRVCCAPSDIHKQTNMQFNTKTNRRRRCPAGAAARRRRGAVLFWRGCWCTAERRRRVCVCAHTT